jgi:hypothetical protein
MLLPRETMPQPITGARLRRSYLVALFFFLLVGGATFTLQTFHKAFYAFGWDDDEGAVWWEAAHVTNLRVLYHPIQQYPYFVVPYPPVFHAVTWLTAKVTGDFLIAGRLVCVFSALGIGLLFGLLVWHVSPQRVPARIRGSGAALATLLCFRLDSLNTYIPEMGVDLLALFFTFLGIYLFIRLNRRSAGLYAAFACFVLAIFTKQTMIAAPLACLTAAALINSRRALHVFLFCVSLGIAGLGYLTWASDGEALRHLFLYNASQPFSFAHWILGMQANLIGMIPIASVACLALLPLMRYALPGNHLISSLRAGLQSSVYRRALFVLGLELAVALLISLTYGKNGSGVHYFLEWNFACCPLAGLLFVRALNSWRPSSPYSLGAAAVFVLLFFSALTGFPDSLRRIDSVYRLTSGERRVQDAKYSSAAAALQVIEQTPGPVLCENMVLVMKAHKEIPIEPGIQNFLSRAGIWDQSGFVQMITSQKFGVIIMRTLDNGFWTDATVQAIEHSYVPTEQIGDESVEDSYYTVYRPRRSEP